MLNYKSLFGTTDLTVDEANITNLAATNITSNTITSNTINSGSVTASGTVSANLVTTPSLNSIAYVNPTMTTAQLNAIINDTQYNVIEFTPAVYYLTSYLNVKRSSVILRGNRSLLFLNSGVQEPNLFIGDMTTNPPTSIYSGITVMDFVITGMKAFQASETSITHPWIYNNGIGINKCQYVWIKDCIIRDCRSGGFTATYQCKYINVEGCELANNYFDGLTCYGSENIIFANNHCHAHSNGAGISIDNNNLYLIMQGNTLTNNKHAIFARETYDCVMSGNTLSGNYDHSLFLSGYAAINDKACERWTITGNSISNNAGAGLFMQGCNDCVVTGNSIYNNGGNGINITSYAGMPFATYGAGKRNNITGNTITKNGDVGFYNDASNSYANGARDNYLQFNIIKDNVNGQVVGDMSAWNKNDEFELQSEHVTTSNVLVNENISMLSTSASNGIYSNQASFNNGGVMMDSQWGNLYFKGGYYGNTFAIVDKNGNRCLDVYNNGTNKVSINSGSLGLADGTGSTVLKSASSGSAQTIVFPSSAGSAGDFLKTDGAGNTTWGNVSVVSATNFHIGTGSAASGSLTYDSSCSNATSGIISNTGIAQALPSNPKGYLTLTIQGQGTVAVPFYDQTFA